MTTIWRVAWHSGFGGTHTQDVLACDVVKFVHSLNVAHADWVEIDGMYRR